MNYHNNNHHPCATIIASHNNRQHHSHVNRVTFTEEDFDHMDLFSDPFLDDDNFHQTPPCEQQEDSIPPALVFNDYEPLPVDTISGHDEMFPRTSHNSDAIRIPSMDSDFRWYPNNPPKTGHTEFTHAGESSIRTAQRSILEDFKCMTYHQQQSSLPKKALIPGDKITDLDVICERGGKSNRHAGTKRYRGVIEKYKPEYQSLASKSAKTSLSKNIIAQIQRNGGRFLKKDEGSQEYFVLSLVETTKKVSQALREKKILKWTQN